MVDGAVTWRNGTLLLDDLRGNIGSPSCQHILVVGPRGCGKTMLLARVAAELRGNGDFAGSLLPVRFMEESQEIFSLTDFWLETMFHLANEVDEHDPGLARELRDNRDVLASRWREQITEAHARAAVLGAADRLGTQLVLIVENLQVMLYIVPSTAEAVRMFETVNDRGRPLTNLEKTMSILMYAAYLVVDDPTTLDKLLSDLNSQFSEIYRCFQDIEEGLGLRDAGEIQRYHHVFFFGQRTLHKHMQVLKDLLMEKSREDREGCERFIRSYARSLRQAFGTIQDIAKRRRNDSTLGQAIDRLFLVGPVGNLNPLLIAAWQKFRGDSEREEILRLFEAFVLRVYRVVRWRSHTGRSTLNWLAYHVHRDFTFNDFQQRLQQLNLDYVTDDRFRRELSGTHCYGNLGTKTIKYLLAQYEHKLRTKAGERITLPLAEILSSEFETEHILPQRPAGGLDEEAMAAHEEIVHRLGNLTIAAKKWNQSMGNRPFQHKKKTYDRSILRVQRDLATYAQWNESTIQERGDEIINFASERWQIDPTSGA